MTTIYCRSNQQHAEDRLIEAHDWVCDMLNTVSSGRCLYIGDERRRLRIAKEAFEKHIMAGTVPRHDAFHYVPIFG
jgi:hypothetical protein